MSAISGMPYAYACAVAADGTATPMATTPGNQRTTRLLATSLSKQFDTLGNSPYSANATGRHNVPGQGNKVLLPPHERSHQYRQ